MFDKVIELVTDKAIELVTEVTQYVNLRENLKKLDKMISVLDHQASDVVTIVENEELYRGKKRKREVEEWLKEVEKKKKDSASLKEQAQQARCISYSRIQLAQRANAMVDEISSLTQQRGFFGELLLDAYESKGLPLVEIEWRGPSFQRNLQEIWALLMNEEITSVGIYGMGGVGKTTLAKFIHNDLYRETIFSGQVYWITASQEASIHKVQLDIAKAIQLDLSDEDDEMRRAAKLFQALKRRGKFVILVDDVWTDFDVEKMGIPLQGNKLIVTSRSVEVCCKIDCQMQIKVTPLCQEEGWELFKRKLGRHEELPSDVKEIAKSLAEKCVGLPLAIATVAGSMKGVGDDIYDWRDALDDLEQCSVGEDDVVFPILEYSYNRLRDQRLKDCFLCCSLYPEDWKIQREELIILFISEGLIEKRSRQAEFDCGHRILNKLENVCLLESGDDVEIGKYVKMHDLIRDMALKKTESSKPKYMVKAHIELKDIPEESKWNEDLEKVSLMHNHIRLIPMGKSPKCPKLSTLFLRRNDLCSISNSFFAHLGKLQILDLSHNIDLKKLPDCISDMKNLEALFLQRCGISLVPPLGKLEALRELNLRATKIEEVPKGLEKLVKLRSLNMEWTGLRIIPDGILSKLCSLRNLQIPYSVKVRAEELEALKDLEELRVRFSPGDNLNQFVQSLQSHRRPNFYRIRVEPDDIVHGDIMRRPHRMTYRTVELHHLGLGGGKSELLLPEGTEILEIKYCHTLSSTVTASLLELNLIQSRGLTECKIEKLEGIKWILKLTSSSNSSFSSSANQVEGREIVVEEDEGQIGVSSCAPRLESLELSYLPDLLGFLEWESAIADATLRPPIFPCLKTLKIFSCHQVTKLFTPKLLLRHLQNLQVLYVADCEGVEEIIIAENEDTSGIDQCSKSPRTNTTTVVQASLPKLKELNLLDLTKLRSIYKGTLICDSVETIFIRGCSNLKRMPLFLPTNNGQLSPPPTLRNIQVPKAEQEWWESLEWDNPQCRHVIQPFVSF